MRIVVLAVAVLLGLPALAGAIPPDDPIESISPDEGATVPTNPDGILVRFLCPPYTIANSSGFPLPGGIKDYGVTLSTSPALGPDGRLDGTRNTAAADTSVGPDACASMLGAGGSRPTIQETPGTYYWQAYRICTDCPGGYETGPVRKLVLVSTIKPQVSALRNVYAGYPFIATLKVTDAPDGTLVTIERQKGGSWTRVGTATALGGKAEGVVTLPRGNQRLRGVVTIGEDELAGPVKGVAVKKAAGWKTGASSDGPYKGKAGSRSVKLTVAGKGRQIRNYSAFVAMTCPGVTPGTFTTQIGTAKVRKAKIAPDGSFVAATTVQGASIRIRGKLKGRRITGGRVEMSLGTCVGNSAFSAAR